jgi:hypothetical protein
MSRIDPTFAECERYLLVDDTDDDVTEILTIACESFGSRTRPSDTFDGGQA